jgi:aarF domain-containing kinase
VFFLSRHQVAVKVLHKNLLQSASIDMQTAFFLVRMLHAIYPQLDFLWLAEEISENLPKEMDFFHETANRNRAAALNTRADIIVRSYANAFRC